MYIYISIIYNYITLKLSILIYHIEEYWNETIIVRAACWMIIG